MRNTTSCFSQRTSRREVWMSWCVFWKGKGNITCNGVCNLFIVRIRALMHIFLYARFSKLVTSSDTYCLECILHCRSMTAGYAKRRQDKDVATEGVWVKRGGMPRRSRRHVVPIEFAAARAALLYSKLARCASRVKSAEGNIRHMVVSRITQSCPRYSDEVAAATHQVASFAPCQR